MGKTQSSVDVHSLAHSLSLSRVFSPLKSNEQNTTRRMANMPFITRNNRNGKTFTASELCYTSDITNSPLQLQLSLNCTEKMNKIGRCTVRTYILRCVQYEFCNLFSFFLSSSLLRGNVQYNTYI